MSRRIKASVEFFAGDDTEENPCGAARDLPTWTNVLVTDDMPIRWTTEDGDPWPGDELAGRLVIGDEDQLIIDMCGAAATKLLAVLVGAHHDRNALPVIGGAVPARVDVEQQRGRDRHDPR